MGICVLTIQDESDGSVSVGFTTDPVVESQEQTLTEAQLLGLMCFHNLITEINAEITEPNDPSV